METIKRELAAYEGLYAAALAVSGDKPTDPDAEPQEPELHELTLREVADKFGMDVETLRIKEQA